MAEACSEIDPGVLVCACACQEKQMTKVKLEAAPSTLAAG